MKRSEMIKILSRALICPHVIISEGVEDCFVPKAKYILDLIEKSDMLPPPNPNEYSMIPTVTPTGNLDYSFKREWEPEDEN